MLPPQQTRGICTTTSPQRDQLCHQGLWGAQDACQESPEPPVGWDVLYLYLACGVSLEDPTHIKMEPYPDNC